MQPGQAQEWVKIRDVQITKIGGQWDVHVGDEWHLCRAGEERVVFEVAASFIQLVNDESMLGEDASSFLSRLGLDYVRDRIVRYPERRRPLLARFMREHRRRRDITRSDDIVLALLNDARARAS
jgi:NAD(P)H-nitrite reductase large subunit